MVATVGIDEVGRGCWAGPVVAGAVLLPADFAMPVSWKLGDSKRLSKLAREVAAAEIHKVSSVGVGWVPAEEVDALGLTRAVRLAMQRALQQVARTYDEIIIDGSYNFLADEPKARAVVKADGSVPSVSAASIVAKVARDQYMGEQAALFPGYGFEAHVGYGTRQHSEALRSLGPCELHRLSYKPIQRYVL